MEILLIALGCSFATCLAITPLVRKLATRVGLTDKPDNHRKLHGRPIPMGGGIAVFVAFAGTVCLLPLIRQEEMLAAVDFANLGWLLAASMVIIATGLLDDRFHLRGRHKLLGQLFAASVVVGAGLVIRNVTVFGYFVDLGPLAVPLTIFWLIGAINSLNLIDGIDGLATSVGVILSGSIAAMALMAGHSAEAVVAIALTGSLLGFLRYNFPPAKMFLGDTGSMFIGLVVGVLAIRSSMKGPATVAFAAPLAIWSIPVLDSTAAILRRKLTGRSIYTIDRAHLHHRLMERLKSNRLVLGVVGVCCALTCGGALISVWAESDIYAAASMVCLVGILVTTQLFGHVEAKLLASKFRTASNSVSLPFRRGAVIAENATIRMQGSRRWELLWETLLEATEKLDLHSICLDVNLPVVQEGFHGNWRRSSKADADDLWRTSLPLVFGKRSIGRLTVSGLHNCKPVYEILQLLVEMIEPFEVQLASLAGQPATNGASSNPLVPPPHLKGRVEALVSSKSGI